jgi:hypothetical protein
MSALRKEERAAIAAVARHFSASWEEGGGSPDAYVTIAGRRIAAEIAAIGRSHAERRGLTRPRLRFDKVVLRLIGGLQEALREEVPEGQALILTATAPIRLPAKTAAVLEERIRVCLARRSAKVEIEETIHGNRVRVRLVKDISRRASKVIGFVHNHETDPEVLLHLAQSLLQEIGAALDKPPPRSFTGERWLVIADGLAHIETYRQVHAQLSIATEFKRILVVLAGGRVESLTG